MATANALPKVQSLGPPEAVTGSCYFLQSHGQNLLVDCGLSQGEGSPRPFDQWPVPPAAIDYLLLSHAHVDHSGRIPELIAAGFTGEILASQPTAALLVPMLEDTMILGGQTPATVAQRLRELDKMAWGFEFHDWFELKNGLRFQLRRTGHILGASSIHLQSRDPSWSIVFSGDLGARDKPLLPDPDPLDPCDLLLLESTYGGSRHDRPEDRAAQLGQALVHALADKGKVFIPAFALGRTQELLYELDQLMSAPKYRELFPQLQPVPVFVDSPLAQGITDIYMRLAPFWDREARAQLRQGNNPLQFGQLFTTEGYREHAALVNAQGPCVIIAGHGMCAGGRILDHLKAGLDDPRNDLVFVGYQARGTPGFQILDALRHAQPQVVLENESVPIRATVRVLQGYSGHADQQELLDWVATAPERPGLIRLVHGEPPAREALARRLIAADYRVEM